MLTAVLDGLSKHGCYEVPLGRAQENLKHGAALTYASIQARTCHGTVQLLDWSSRRFTRRHLVMGLSRATAIDRVWLGES